MDNMTLDDYRKLVEQVMRETLSAGNESTPRVFTNIGKDHAAVVLNTMLDYAQSSVCTYSDKLSGEVWSAEKVSNFLRRAPTATMRVIVDQAGALDDASSALSHLRYWIAGGRIEVRHVGKSRMSTHICVADGRHLRLEDDAQSRKATVVFGDSELGGAAVTMFDACWRLSTVTPIASAA